MMTAIKRLICLLGILFTAMISLNIAAAQTFVIKKFKVEGLTHLTPSTVLSYVPLKVGDTFTEKIH
jgi:outer membrane protein assembly factor BamA